MCGGSQEARRSGAGARSASTGTWRLKAESGDSKPVDLGPALGLRLPTGTGGTRAQAGRLVSTPPPACSSAVAVGAL